MPTYEYACTACGHELEAVQKFSDDPLTECPECGSPLRKVYGAVGIVLKGSGFYKTDSRAANGSNGKNGNGGRRSEAASSGESSSGSEKSEKKDSTGSDSGTKSDGGGSSDSTGKDSKATTTAAK